MAPEHDSAPPREIRADELARAKAYAEAASKSECERLRKAPLHQRNNTLNACGFKLGRLAARGLLDPARVTAELTQIAKAIGLDDGEIARTIDSGLKAGTKNPARLPFEKGASAKSAESPPRASGDELTKRLAALGEDDIANAERFVLRYGHKVIYSETRGFLVFDGKRYRPNAHLRCVELAKDVVTRIADEPPHIGSEEARARRAKFARESRSKSAIDRLLDLAKGRLVVDDKVLDADPWLLNSQTWTIDLRTGRYHAHDARDLLTKVSPVEAKAKSECPMFEKFIERITGGDAELATYIQKVAGYSLTGITSAQVLFFVYGKSGNNGKSTLVNLIHEMLGDYGAHTPTETLLTKNYDKAIPADLARLEGKRMVTAIESNVNRQLDEAKIKAMTGGEPITARHLYKNFSEFTPQFKLWFVANDRPHVRATDDAIWRRIRVIPLNVRIPVNEVDPDLPSKLRAELPGILSWAIRGALRWRSEGLAEPESIRSASAEWRDAVDHVRRFVTETLIIGCAQNEVVPAGELHSRFKTWCARNGERPMSAGRFKARLEEMFDLTHAETKRGSEWRGVRWKS
jgi:putative DNA primase/helicase